MAESKKKSVFEVMSAVDVTPYLFEKNKMVYLPWSRAIEQLKLKYPDAKVTECTFRTPKFITAIDHEGKEAKGYNNVIVETDMPYYTDGRTCFVQTRLEIPSENVDECCTLPVMDFKNQCIPADKITMSDVNKSLRRCATKNIAMATGLGLGLWHKEEMSETAASQKIIDKLDRNDAISKFKTKVKEGYDRDKLAVWLKTNFNTSNPQTLNDELLERLNTELDKLDIKDFQPEKKTKKEG